MSTLEIMDRTGDTKLIWSADQQAEVDAAKTTFDSLKAKGYVAYSVGTDGSTGEVIKSFDPNAERIIMRPAMQGG